MKPIYIKENKDLKYFLFGMNEKETDVNEEIHISGIENLKNNSFSKNLYVKRIFFDDKLKKIEKEAFNGCEVLEIFGCCISENQQKSEIVNLKVNESKKEVKEGKEIKSMEDDFTIQTLAFSGCENLRTVIFPKCSKLIIEKSAFENCYSLRTVVAVADEISFTENPFEDCPKELTFVCKENSKVERFARENEYRIIYV